LVYSHGSNPSSVPHSTTTKPFPTLHAQAFTVAATIEQQGFIHPSLDFDYFYAHDSGGTPSTVSDLTLPGDHIFTVPARKSTSSKSSPRRPKGNRYSPKTLGGGQQQQQQQVAAMAGQGTENSPGTAAQPVNKPKRVRTGCLTCRERHLKCDEAAPICQNCRKSNRTCKRGVRLNFIDTQVNAPPIVPPSHEWTIMFQDESRDIASEYKGGLGRYSNYKTPEAESRPRAGTNNTMSYEFPTSMPPPASTSHQPLPPIQGILPESYSDEQQNMTYEHHREPSHHHSHSHTESSFSATLPAPQSAYSNNEQSATPSEAPRDYLDSQEEVLFMQVFVEEVGLWMDSMDPMKHVGSETLLIIATADLDFSSRDFCRFTPWLNPCCSTHSWHVVQGISPL